MWHVGLVAPRHVGSSQARARTCVPCNGRQILNHCATREVPVVGNLNWYDSWDNFGQCLIDLNLLDHEVFALIKYVCLRKSKINRCLLPYFYLFIYLKNMTKDMIYLIWSGYNMTPKFDFSQQIDLRNWGTIIINSNPTFDTLKILQMIPHYAIIL